MPKMNKSQIYRISELCKLGEDNANSTKNSKLFSKVNKFDVCNVANHMSKRNKYELTPNDASKRLIAMKLRLYKKMGKEVRIY